jgi:hypothetical protein
MLPLLVRPIPQLFFPCRILTWSDSGVPLHAGDIARRVAGIRRNIARCIVSVRRNIACWCGRNQGHLYVLSLRQVHALYPVRG